MPTAPSKMYFNARKFEQRTKVGTNSNNLHALVSRYRVLQSIVKFGLAGHMFKMTESPTRNRIGTKGKEREAKCHASA